jgi:hypothetical protein
MFIAYVLFSNRPSSKPITTSNVHQRNPLPPKSKGTPDEQFAKYLADQREGLETMKKNVAQMPRDLQKQMQSAVKQMEAVVERSDKDPPMAAMMKQSFQQCDSSEQRDFQDRLAKYEKKVPADSRVLIAARLHEFLESSHDIAFEAKLVPGPGGKMKFADPRYDAKSSQWKLCYRAGREPVQAAREFATGSSKESSQSRHPPVPFFCGLGISAASINCRSEVVVVPNGQKSLPISRFCGLAKYSFLPVGNGPSFLLDKCYNSRL